ncbi:hypothetical protein [Aurantimonas manganoxydans]|nr:hypothetical protein [Aurantimonas manganoxydans]
MSEHRDQLGRFKPGAPGRKPGALGRAPKMLLAQVRAMGPTAVEKLWEAVHAGERWAVEAVLGYVLPRDRVIELDRPAAEDVREALASGDLSASEASDLTSALVRLHALEAAERSNARKTISVDYTVRIDDDDDSAAEKYKAMIGAE